MSTQGVAIAGHSVAGIGAIPGLGLGQTGYTIGNKKMSLPGINIKITPANGGTIITVSEDFSQDNNSIVLGQYQKEELYVIPDGVEDFDRELGKIITMHRMKQKHE